MKYLRIALGIAISALFLFLAFRGVRFDEVGNALRRVQWAWLLPGVAFIVLSLVIRAVRWRLLFYPHNQLRLSNVFGAMNTGYLVNTVLPARLGEVVRAVMLSQVERVRTAHALSTVVVERVLDMLVTVLLLALVLPFVTLPAGATIPLLVGSALAVVALVVMAVAATKRDLTHRIIKLVSARLPARIADRVHGYLDQFLEGFAVLNRPRVAASLALLSAAAWLTAAASMYCVLFGFGLRLPPTAPIFVLALVSISFIVPSSPGHVGVFHLAVVKALDVGFGVDPTTALSYAFVAHIVSFAPPTLLGLWFVWRSGASLANLVRFGKRVEHPPPAELAEAPATQPALTRQ